MADGEQNDLIWKADSSSVEIRFQGQLEDGRPALDEIVGYGASLHLEQMDHDQWWMGIQAGGKDSIFGSLWKTGGCASDSPIRMTKTHSGKATIERNRCRERMPSGPVVACG